MKILYIANIRLPTEKAHGLHIVKMCEAFSRNGEQVELVVPRRFNSMKEDPFEFYDVKPLFTIRRIFCLDLVRFGKVGFWIQSFSFTLFAMAHVLRHRQSVLYTRDPLVAYSFGFFSTNVVFEVHTKHLTPIMRGAFTRSRRIVFITHGLKNLYLNAYSIPKEKILVEPDATDLSYFNVPLDKGAERRRLGIPEDVSVVGYVGGIVTMGANKGVEEIIEAVSRTDARLLFCGVGNDGRETLASLLKNHNMTHLSTVVEDISQKRMAVYMRIADVLVMNYPSAEHYALYMSPLKMFSYMASGVPIVSTDLPSVREVLTDESAFFVSPDDAHDLTRGLKEALADRRQAGEKAHAAKERGQHFSWEGRAGRILAFISR